MQYRAWFVLSLGLAACAPGDPPAGPGGQLAPGVMGAVPEGYTRYITTETELAPGQEVILNEWLSLPADEDLDVADVRGESLPELHHYILYSTTHDEPVGSVRPWQDSDQITLGVRLLGGFGQEAAGGYHTPDGAVFRLTKGRSLMANVHYLNATSSPIKARAWVDVKLVPPSPERQVLGMLTSVDTALHVPAHAESTYDVSCEVQHDVGLIAWANHMHELGASAYTEVIRADGTKEDLRRDETWSGEWAFNPHFATWPLEAPFLLRKGDTLHGHCAWKNPTPDEATFPHEMCVGLGFFAGEKDVTCLSGKWME